MLNLTKKMTVKDAINTLKLFDKKDIFFWLSTLNLTEAEKGLIIYKMGV